jgi:hypothetical protein
MTFLAGANLKKILHSFLTAFFSITLTLALTCRAQAQQRPDLPNPLTPALTIYAYNYWYPQYLETYLKKVDAVTTATPQADHKAQCLPVFKNSLKSKVFDIRYALGYFDDSKGEEVVYEGINYGLSPSLDISIFDVVREFLQKPCTARRALCGFAQSGDPKQGKVILEKQIQLMGSEVLARITLTHASASESFIANTGSLKERQAFLTQQSEENYFGGLGKADVVFYNGHSRNGGGPDFKPPHLNSELHVNYNGYYKVKKPGIRKVIEKIRQGENKDSVIGFFSCSSYSHFYEMLLDANPKQRMVLSSDLMTYLDTLYGSMGYLEGLLHGQCGQDLADTAKQTEAIKEGFKGFQIR